MTWCCPGCGCIIPESVMRKQPAKWVAENPEAYEKGIRSFWLNAFSSPWTPWSKIALEFLDAKDDPERLKVVYNTLFGQLWDDRGDLEDEDTMLARREDYGLNADGTQVELPDGALVLTCGVDTQDNRLEYEVVGHGHYGETWGIVKGFIMGRPDTEEVWERLDDVIDHVYKFRTGRGLKISITCIDSGGHFTQEVYEACRARVHKRVFAIKGKGGDGIPFVSPPTRVAIRDNKKITCWLYILGVDAGKASIMGNLKVKEAGPKFCHFNRNPDAGFDLNYFNGLLSEKLVLTHTSRGDKWSWEKLPGHNRNEALDCRNYAMAGFKIINPDMDAVERRLKGLTRRRRVRRAEVRNTERKRIKLHASVFLMIGKEVRMNTRKAIESDLEIKRTRLNLYYKREAEMLDRGVQSYGMGSRNLARYNTDLGQIRIAIKELEDEIKELEGRMSGGAPRKAVGVVPRDW